jgi:tetratricopeptide (TPR) repeat protein
MAPVRRIAPNHRLRQQREQRGWTREFVARELSRLAAELHQLDKHPDAAMVAKWELGHKQPGRLYRLLLCVLFDLPAEQLGFLEPEEAVHGRADADEYTATMRDLQGWIDALSRAEFADNASALMATAIQGSWSIAPQPSPQVRVAVREPRQLTSSLLDELDGLAEVYRRLDRQLGAPTIHEDVTRHLLRLNRLREASMTPASRDRLTVLAGEVASLAGWQAVDMGLPTAAWSLFNVATRAAKEANDRGLHAFTVAVTSYVPMLFGKERAAPLLVSTARRLAGDRVSPTLRAWLAAVDAEAHATVGDVAATYRALDHAEALLAAASPGESPRWLAYLDPANFLRWKGRCLVHLRQARQAQPMLEQALIQADGTFVRGRSGSLVDLATAYVQQEDIDEGCRLFQEALRLAHATRSTRHLRRVVSVRHQLLEPWRGHPAVAGLDAQLRLAS